MPMNRSFTRALGGLFALALMATACGGDDTGDSSAQTTAKAATDAGAAAKSMTGGATDKSGWPAKLRYAAVPSSEEKAQVDRYQPMVDILSDELGMPVEFNFATSYSAVIESMIAGNVDIAQFGAFSYVIATGNGADITPVAIATKEGKEPSYRSYGITQANNDGITSIKDFAGKAVCFVDPGSTSGFLFPSAGLLEVGIDPETGVKGTFAGGHDASALSVANGTCEAGFAFDTMVTTQLIEQGDLHGVIDKVESETVNPDQAELKIVWKGPDIPNGPVAIQNKLPQSLRDEVSRVFLEEINVDSYVKRGKCTSKDDCKIGDEDAGFYGKVNDSLYDGVRRVCEQTKSAKCALS